METSEWEEKNCPQLPLSHQHGMGSAPVGAPCFGSFRAFQPRTNWFGTVFLFTRNVTTSVLNVGKRGWRRPFSLCAMVFYMCVNGNSQWMQRGLIQGASVKAETSL